MAIRITGVRCDTNTATRVSSFACMTMLTFTLIHVETSTLLSSSAHACIQQPQEQGQEKRKKPLREFPRTLSETITDSEVVLFGKRASIKTPGELSSKETVTFEVVHVLKGDSIVSTGELFEAECAAHDLVPGLFFFSANVAQSGGKAIAWRYRSGISKDDEKYLTALLGLKKQGVARLEYFMSALEHTTWFIADNAHLEFALATDEDLIALQDQMNHEQLVQWVQNPDVEPRRARLYLAMLSICNDQSDIKWIESWLQDDQRDLSRSLDGWISLYLSLKGPEGLPLVNRLFFEDKMADYVDTLRAINSLRHFADLKSSPIPKDEIVRSLRLVLERPKLADMVVPDLVRLEDWSSMNRIAELFREANGEFGWIRVPAVIFMQECPRPEAEEYLTEFENIDPDSVKRARIFADPAMNDSVDDDAKLETKENSAPTQKFLRPYGRRPWRGFGC